MEYVTLKEVCKIKMGQSPDSSSYNDVKEGIPFFQGNADFGERYPIPRVWCNAPKKIAESGDILISVRAPIGALNYAKDKCCIGRGVAAITPDENKVVSEFVYWLLKSKKDELNTKGTGSTFKAIGRKVLEGTMLPNFDKNKQYKCVEVLEKTYSVIQKKKQELKLFDELIKARFVEMFENYYKNKIKEKSLCVISRFIDYRGKTPQKSESGIPLITAKNVRNNKFSIVPQEFIPEENYDAVMTRGVPMVNDVLFTTEAPLGNVCRIPAIYEKFCVGQRLITIQPHTDLVNSEYLEYALTSVEFQEKMWQKSSGSTVKGIRSKLLSSLTIPVPPIELQNQFADFVHQVDKSKVAVQKALDEAQLLFDSLMQEYFG